MKNRFLIFLGLEIALVGFIRAAAPGPIFHSFSEPLRQLAQTRRSERNYADPNWRTHVDPGLNRDRINFVIYVFGDNYEPSAERATVTKTGSYTILSLDLKKNQYAKVTLSRDFASPEVARRKTGDPTVMNPDTRISEAFAAGGFDFARAVIEDATGLSADFQINIPDTLIADLVDALDGVDVDVPIDLDLHEFYINSTFYPARFFANGRWHMDGLTALGYAKAMAKGEYTQDSERYLRAQAVLDAAFIKLRAQVASRDVVMIVPRLFHIVEVSWRGARSVPFGTASGQVCGETTSMIHAEDCFAKNARNYVGLQMDFDPKIILMHSATTLAQNILPALLAYGFDPGLPQAGQGLYVAPEYQGGGGGWRIPPGDMVIPIDGNPNDDPVSYWRSVREFIRGKLMASP